MNEGIEPQDQGSETAAESKYYKHEKSLVETDEIGEGTRIWAFVHILEGARIGRNANICDHCFIEDGVEIGDDVTLKCGVYLWKGIKVENKVFVGPAAVFTNDLKPRSKNVEFKLETTLIKEGSSIGANATILAGKTIGRYSMIGAGSVVTKDVPDYALVYGNPAIIKGYICECGNKMVFGGNAFNCDCGKSYLNNEGKVERAGDE